MILSLQFTHRLYKYKRKGLFFKNADVFCVQSAPKIAGCVRRIIKAMGSVGFLWMRRWGGRRIT